MLATEAPFISLHNLTATEDATDIKLLTHLDLQIHKGEWIWIVGPPRSGKTTLCHILSGFSYLDEEVVVTGEARMLGQSLLQRSSANCLVGQIGVVSHQSNLNLIFDIVEDELAFAPENLKLEPSYISQKIDESLQQVNLLAYRNAKTNSLSGGQRQRVSIASVLTMSPQLLIFDDATASLDLKSTKQLWGMLTQLKEAGHTIVVTSSRVEKDLIEQVDRLVLLEHGCKIAEGKAEQFIRKYNEQLIEWGCLPQKRVSNINASAEVTKNDKPILEINQLTYSYPEQQAKGQRAILDNYSLKLFPGQFVSLEGENGVGKTTLGKLIAGIITPPKRTIRIQGHDVSRPTDQFIHHIGYVFQHPEHQFITESVLEECTFALKAKHGIMPWEQATEAIEAEALQYLEQFDLVPLAPIHPMKLNTSEKKLLNLASATILQPSLLILDEPTTGVNFAVAEHIMKWCANYVQLGKSVLMITHDHELASLWTNDRIVLTGSYEN